MLSVLRKKSYGPVKVFWLDQKKVLAFAEQAAKKILQERPEVLQVGIFGSIAKGRAAPGSDLDMFVIIKPTKVGRIHRAEPYQNYFDTINIAVDLLCLTEEETQSSSFYQRNYAETIWFKTF